MLQRANDLFMGSIDYLKKMLTGISAIGLAIAVIFQWFALDLTDFRTHAHLTAVVASNEAHVEWDVVSVPEEPAEIYYFVDGELAYHKHYPQGLKSELGRHTSWIDSFSIPVNSSEKSSVRMQAVWYFQGWTTVFIPKAATFTTTVKVF